MKNPILPKHISKNRPIIAVTNCPIPKVSIAFVLLAVFFVLGGCGTDQEDDTNALAEPILAVTATSTLPPATSATAATELPTSTEQIAADDPPNSAGCSFEPHLDFFGHPDFDALRQSMGCAIDEPLFDPVAINEFGDGPEFNRFMIWTSIDGMIYVMRPDNGWEIHADTWSADEPEIACSLSGFVFASPPLPRRGFGKLWCESELLQETMGTIVREERLCQHAVLQQFERGQLLACFEDATYRYFRIMEDQTWESVFIQ